MSFRISSNDKQGYFGASKKISLLVKIRGLGGGRGGIKTPYRLASHFKGMNKILRIGQTRD